MHVWNTGVTTTPAPRWQRVCIVHSQLHQALHGIRDSEARLRHHLPRLLGDVRLRLHLAEFVCVLPELPQNLLDLGLRRRREVVLAYCNNTGYNSDDLSEVFAEGRGWCWAADAGEHALDGVHD